MFLIALFLDKNHVELYAAPPELRIATQIFFYRYAAPLGLKNGTLYEIGNSNFEYV